MAETVIDRLVTELVFRGDAAALDRLDSRIERTKQRLNTLSRGFLLAGAGLTAGAAATLKTFANYEREMAKIEGLVGVSRKQLDEWTPAIANIAKVTGIGPDKLIESMFFVTSAGLRGKEALDVLTMSAKASAAGLGDQVPVVDLLTSAVNAYGSASLNAKQGVDALTAAVRLGKLAPETMAGAMGQVLPVASKMGVSFQEVAGMMAAMSRTGTDAPRGATQLTAIMSQLLKPQTQALSTLEEAGLTIADIRKKIGEDGLIGALRMIEDAVGGDDAKLAAIFGNIRALRGIFDMLGHNADITQEIIEGVKNSAGITDEAFSIMEGTLSHLGKVVLARFKTMLILVGSELRVTTQRVIAAVGAVFDWFERLGETGRKTIAWVLTLGPGLLILGGALRVLAFALSPLRSLFLGAMAAANLFNASMHTTAFAAQLAAVKQRLYAIATGIASAATTAFNFILNANPIVRIITLIGLLAGAIFALAADWGHIFTGIWNIVRRVGVQLWKEISIVAGAIKTLAVGIYDFIVGIFNTISDVMGWIRGKIRDLLPDWLVGWITGNNGDTSPPIEGNDFVGLTQPLPTASPAAAAGGNQSSNVSQTAKVEIGKIDINAPGADSKEISQNIGKAMRDQLEHAVTANDSMVAI